MLALLKPVVDKTTGEETTFFAYPSKLKACCPNTDVTSQCAVPGIRRSNHNGAVVRVNY
jgi:hypothetical protein